MYTDTPRLGETIYQGFEESKGDIITFLDDDDLYHSERLQIIYNTFKENKISGFKNLHYNINEKGEVIGEEANPINESSIILTPSNYKHKIFYYNTGNDSSIAVDRSLINEDIRKIELSCDIYLAYHAICSQGYYLYLKPLSYYRIHSLNTSNPSSIEQKFKFASRNLNDHLIIYDKFSNCSKEIEKSLLFFLVPTKISYDFYSSILNKDSSNIKLNKKEIKFITNPLYLYYDKNNRKRALFFYISGLSFLIPSKKFRKLIYKTIFSVSHYH
ncbi:glycosyltransferase [Acidianus sulfidivorans JP7]|uniref:Glycosyltransferase 2-like domain-containing protein n=1 Tax=Acidianus sulfidivorans JP7 TaxID=619593 RepID=A0A2U9IQC9_9CREN|nr:glycosyltransferase [Acidianus sulfidivorans JP7]